VEGIPLAIELAASWLKMLSCTAIVAEIRRNLDFLNTNLRNVPDRHRSMRAVFDQSWQFLSPAEQEVFAKLSICRGGFQLEAGEQVAGASLFMLSSLVDKSLLRHDPAQRRYYIHELLRQFAREKLMQHPEAVTATRDVHSAYFLSFLANRRDDLLAKRQKEATFEIACELENVRRAWTHAIRSRNVKALRESAYSLGSFYDFSARYIEAINAFERAAAVLDEQNQAEAEALAIILVHLGWTYIRTAQLDPAWEAMERVEAIHQRFQITPPLGLATEPMTGFSVLSMIAGDYDRAMETLELARQRTEARGDRHNLMLTWNIFASAYLSTGDYAHAYHCAELSYDLAKTIGDEWFMAYCLNELGNAASALKDYKQAEQHYRESYLIRSDFGDPEGSAVALAFLGQVSSLQSNYEESLENFHRSLANYRELSDR
ncbi:MAG: tetratricopeptide repeat protein, partial [Anaerolineae bacterium]|nr:tetratricopeptide repeat protein [Anaerolineae bacterium]